MQNEKRILIVDDDDSFAESIQKIFKKFGHLAACAYNGLDALRLSKENDFYMVLIDYNMPGLKGDAVCRSIRMDRPHCFIVGFSSETEIRESFMNAGADIFINKHDLPNIFLF